MNWFSIVGLAMNIATQISAAVAELAAGQPVQVPEIRTYFEGKHLAIDITVKPIA